MPDLVLVLLKFVFLAVLYIFIGRAVRVMILELRPPAAPAPAAQRAAPASRKAKKAPKKLSVIEGENLKGKSFDIGSELVIGRADRCHIVLDDTYVSQVHARVFQKGDAYMVEDLGSTNGTYLNRRKVTSASTVQKGDRIKIGKTVMELRR